jgi:hypothetical protein
MGANCWQLFERRDLLRLKGTYDRLLVLPRCGIRHDTDCLSNQRAVSGANWQPAGLHGMDALKRSKDQVKCSPAPGFL